MGTVERLTSTVPGQTAVGCSSSRRADRTFIFPCAAAVCTADQVAGPVGNWEAGLSLDALHMTASTALASCRRIRIHDTRVPWAIADDLL